MQTFLPYPDFTKSVETLDNRRLNKQVLEARQITNIILKKQFGLKPGYFNHPAVIMWQDNVDALIKYQIACVLECFKRDINSNPDLLIVPIQLSSDPEMPWWFGLEEFHKSHRSNLYRKDPEYYFSLQDHEDGSLPYCWPSKLGSYELGNMRKTHGATP